MEVRSIEAIVRALNAANVQYLVVGGLAVNAHGYERLTRDVDLVIGLERENILRGLRALLALGFVMAIPIAVEDFADPDQREAWRREKNMIVLKLWSDGHRRTPIDVFVYEPFNFSQEFAVAKWLPVAPDVLAPIVSMPALLAMKRVAGRDRDLQDIEILRKISQLP